MFGVLLVLCACGDGQAGIDYRGEVLMTLRASITSSDVPLSAELVPAVKFGPKSGAWWGAAPDSGGLAPEGGRWRTTHFVQAEVEGVFPTEFVMRLYDPPPAETLDVHADGDPPFVMGEITVVEPEHPQWLKRRFGPEDQEICSNEGKCINSTTYEDCWDSQPPPHEDEERELTPEEAEAAEAWLNGTVWPCSWKFPDGYPFEQYGESQGYAILYSAGVMAAGGVMSRLIASGEEIKAGYNLLKWDETQWEGTLDPDIDYHKYFCQAAAEDAQRATMQVYPEFTSIEDFDPDAHPEVQHAFNIEYLRAWDAHGCGLGYRVVDPESPITVSLLPIYY